MNPSSSSPLDSGSSRREFIMTSGKATLGAAMVTSLPRVGYTAERNTIKIALVGCGGRGTGAVANALQTEGPVKLWAVADVFSSNMEACLNVLSKRFGNQIDVPRERRFVGFDGYKKAIDSLDAHDAVLLSTPPVFRPFHVEYAVNKGVHVFMEKPFAVDVPGVKTIQAAGEIADSKNLKIAGGLIGRHHRPLEEAVERIHDRAIGEIVAEYAYRLQGPVVLKPKGAGMSELAYQITNYSGFTWLNGSFMVDWMIQNIDTCCWIKQSLPVSVQGMGGRQTRVEPDQSYDHYMAEFTFPDGTRMVVQGRHMMRCWDHIGEVVHGTEGSALLGEGLHHAKLFRTHDPVSPNEIWRFSGPGTDAYQREQDRFFSAIRNDTPCNESERCAQACLTAIMGRMACESGRFLSRETALKSNHKLAPLLDHLKSLHDPPPVLPDQNGQYPIAMPGFTTVL